MDDVIFLRIVWLQPQVIKYNNKLSRKKSSIFLFLVNRNWVVFKRIMKITRSFKLWFSINAQDPMTERSQAIYLGPLEVATCHLWGCVPTDHLADTPIQPPPHPPPLLCSEISAHCVKIMTTQVSHIFHKLHPFHPLVRTLPGSLLHEPW